MTVHDSPPPSKFRSDIEGLRAVAVVAVVLFHAEMPGLSGGFIGVDVFFVISGFLITGLLWREVSTAGGVRLRRFYGARARRLLPASALVGVVTMIASVALLSPLQARGTMVDGITSALYVGNMWFVARAIDYFSTDAPSPFLHYWSLGVEEQFYLVWPVMMIGTAWLVRIARRRNGGGGAFSKRPYLVVLAVVAVGSFAASLAMTHYWPPAAFFFMPTRAWQLALGGLVALTAGSWRRLPPRAAAIVGWVGLALILLACTVLDTATPYPGTAALLPTLGTALVIGAGCAVSAQGVGRVLALAPMRAVGRVSYSWYLWHWPVLVLAAPLVGHPLSLTARLATVVISAVLAVLTVRFVENPLRFAPSVRGSAGRSLALGGVATAVAVVVGVALLVLIPLPVGRGPEAPTLTVTAGPAPAPGDIEAHDAAVRQMFAQVAAAVAASAAVREVPSNLAPPLMDADAEHATMLRESCMLTPFQTVQPECAAGDVNSETTVALVGDSHAGMWSPAFQAVAAQRHWRLETLAKAGCPLLELPIFSPLLRRQYTECEQWRGQVIARLEVEHPRLVLLSFSRDYAAESGFTSYGSAWIEGLARLVQQLHSAGAAVLVLGPIPNPQSVVPVCLSDHLDDATACSPPRSTAISAPGIAEEYSATQASGGRYADLTGLFCTADRCPAIVGNTLVYLDESHVTLEYARLLAPVIGALADRALAQG